MSKQLKILCPTDLSHHSIIALKYAINLANDLDAELHIISVYNVSKRASSLVDISDKVRENTEKDLDKIVSDILPLVKTDTPPVVNVYKGNAVKTIIKYAEKKEMDLIVMGTQGDNSMRTLLFGSVTRKVTTQSSVPVLAIPESIEHTLHSNKILLALDNKELKDENIFAVPRFIADRLGLKIDILHIHEEDEEDFPFDPFIAEYLGDTIGEAIVKKGTDPIVEIKNHAEASNVGLVIMVRREKSFFERLFISAHTSEEIAKTNTPLMILPE